MHIDVDKKAHRDRQTDRQTREHAEAYKTRRKGSQGRTQRQIKVKIKIKNFKYTEVRIEERFQVAGLSYRTTHW